MLLVPIAYEDATLLERGDREFVTPRRPVGIRLRRFAPPSATTVAGR
jgi:hypothetical protein